MVNTAVLSHPLNYAIVWLMLLIAAIGGHFALKGFGLSAQGDTK